MIIDLHWMWWTFIFFYFIVGVIHTVIWLWKVKNMKEN